LFQLWWAGLYEQIWTQKFAGIPDGLRPSPERTMQLMQAGSELLPNLGDATVSSFEKAVDSLTKLGPDNDEWYHVKNTTVKHLTKLPAFSFADLKIGGWGNTVNAAKGDHGPSWRMVVEMGKDKVSAFGVYPGGQSGNPGSKYYASFLDYWVAGKYYPLSFYGIGTQHIPDNVKYQWNVKPD